MTLATLDAMRRREEDELMIIKSRVTRTGGWRDILGEFSGSERHEVSLDSDSVLGQDNEQRQNGEKHREKTNSWAVLVQ